MTIMYGIGLD